MLCPRCRVYHDMLQYRRLERIPEYASETNVIVFCPSCNWKFSPAPTRTELFGIEGGEAVAALPDHALDRLPRCDP